jgi:hypothetical protein
LPTIFLVAPLVRKLVASIVVKEDKQALTSQASGTP